MKILVALDFDEIAEEVENVAFELAQRLNGEVELVNIVNKNISYAPVSTPFDFAVAWQLQCDKAKAGLEKIQLRHSAIACSIIALVGDPKEDIINKTSELKVAMIILGTHGRTGFAGLLLGSTAEYIVRHSRVPVLVVPHNHTRH